MISHPRRRRCPDWLEVKVFLLPPGRFCPLPWPNRERCINGLQHYRQEVLSMWISDFHITGGGGGQISRTKGVGQRAWGAVQKTA